MSRKRPPLSPDDRELWQRVTNSVTPLREGRSVSRGSARQPASTAATGGPAVPEIPSRLPPLASVDAKAARRIGRRSGGVDATVDLHGLTRSQAHRRLLAFLLRAQASGHRMVLVVTGKGRQRPEHADWWEEGERGVLKRDVPLWLASPEFRPLVVGFEQAHVRLGGEGAIYVQVRKSRSGP